MRRDHHAFPGGRAAAPLHVESVRKHFIDLLSTREIDALGGITEKVVAHLIDDERADEPG